MCVCTLSSWIQHMYSILFSQIWELQNSIFLGSRSWQKCKCTGNIPDRENLHADSRYPWGSFHCAALFCPATRGSCLPWHDKTFCLVLETDGMDQAVAYWQIYTSTLSCAHKTACVRARTQYLEHRTQWRCPVPSKSHRYDVPEVEFKKMTPILRDFSCPAWNEYLSCSANSKSFSTLAQGVTVWSVNRDWQRPDAGRQTGVSLQKRRPKAVYRRPPKHSKTALFFWIVAALIATRSTAPHRFDDANRYALCITFTPFAWRSRSRYRWPDPDPAQPVRRRCSSPATSRLQFQFKCCKRTPVLTHSLSIHL